MHVPVLLKECVKILLPFKGGIFLDATIGSGGHANALLESSSELTIVGLDRDPQACNVAKENLKKFEKRVMIVNENYVNANHVLRNLNIEKVSGIILDLGLSSMQLEAPERGFSFRLGGPLDMRMDPKATKTARDILAGLGERELYTIFKEYGEEPFARKIAREIERWKRRGVRMERTLELAGLVSRIIRRRRSRIHPATRVFQALRIAVNNELENLNHFLNQFDKYLEDSGHLVCISYHSLEDRIAKNIFREKAREGLIKILTKKPVRPTEDEINKNPRARSAKLRACEKI